MSELARRALVGVVAVPLVVAVVHVGGLPLACALAAVAGLGAWEFFRLASAGGVHALAKAGITCAAAFPLLTWAAVARGVVLPVGALAVVVLAIFATAIWRRYGERPLASVGATIFGVLYTGGMLSFGYALRYQRFAMGDAAAGTAVVMLPVLLTWATDTGAYAFGRLFGRRKLMPQVSPGKTIAGAIGGLVTAVVVGGAYGTAVLRPTAQLGFSPWGGVLFAAAVSVAAQVGDLAESLLKREAGVKHTSHLIPGHGGVLDRVDSLLFALPVAHLLMDPLLLYAPTP